MASVQTLPFALKERKGLALAAKWDQRICVEEVEAERVVHADTLVLIEVLQVQSGHSLNSTCSWTAFVPFINRCGLLSYKREVWGWPQRGWL